MSGRLKAWLALGRISNLPTVWANCLAGWMLVAEPIRPAFALIVAAATLLYLAGMFLNDAWDAPWDAVHRPNRPIPAGRISRFQAGAAGLFLIVVAWIVAALAGLHAWIMAVAVTGTVVLYTLFHKKWAGAYVLMAVCRGLLYPLAAAAALSSWPPPSVAAPAMVLMSYVLVVSIAARNEKEGQPLALAARIALVIVPAAGGFILEAAPVWILTHCAAQLFLWGLEHLLKSHGPATIGRLIALMPVVDLIACDPRWGGAAMLLLLMAASSLHLQRRVRGS